MRPFGHDGPVVGPRPAVRLIEGVQQGIHVLRIHMISIRAPGDALLSRPESQGPT